MISAGVVCQSDQLTALGVTYDRKTALQYCQRAERLEAVAKMSEVGVKPLELLPHGAVESFAQDVQGLDGVVDPLDGGESAQVLVFKLQLVAARSYLFLDG